MATILVVDDRPTNREYLVTLLGYSGHRLLEAGDGTEALGLARAEHPDLVITDILMPTMDGVEFANRLHADPALAQTPIVFYTATYLEREAHILAQTANVAHVIIKPAEPQTILDTVGAALGTSSPAQAALSDDVLKHRLTHELASHLIQKVGELDLVSKQRAALVDLGVELASERDPQRLLQAFCHAARRILGAKYAAIGMPDAHGQTLGSFLISGLDAETAAAIGPPPSGKGLLGELATTRQPLRVADIAADPRSTGFPPGHPPMRSFLGVPIATAMQAYGRLYLTDKLGADEFSEEDERIAVALAAQVAVAYENARLYDEIQRRAADLEREAAQRHRVESQLRRSETMYRALVEQIPSVTYRTLVEPVGRLVYISPQIETLLGFTQVEWLGDPDLARRQTHPDDRDRVVAEKTRSRLAAEPFRSEYRFLARDGHVVWVRDESIVVLNDVGLPLFVQGVILDITERKLAEAHIAHLNQVLRALREVNRFITREKDPVRLLQQACESLIETRDYRSVWIRQIKTGYSQLATLARAGQDPRLLERILPIDESGAEWEFTEKAVRTREPVVLRLSEGHSASGSPPMAGDMGKLSLASVPMIHSDRLFGVVNVCAGSAEGFDAAELSLLVELAGDLAFALQSIEDDDARKRTERSLHENEKRFRALIDNAPDGITLLGADGKLLYASPSTQRIMGYGPDEISGADPARLTHPDDLPMLLGVLNDLIQKPGHVLTTQYRLLHKDGSWRWLESTISNLLTESSVGAIVFNYRDITERKQAEDKLQVSDAIIRRAGALILVADADGRIAYVSSSVKAVLGYEPEELVGDGWWNLSRDDPAEREREKTYLARCARGEVPLQEEPYERLVVRRDGERRWILWQDAKGPAQTVVGVGQDITERKQREREMEAIVSVAAALRAAPTRGDMLPVILNEVIRLLNVGGAALVMRDPNTDENLITMARGAWSDLTGKRFPAEAGLSGQVIATGEPYLSNDVRSESRSPYADIVGKLPAVAGAPLIEQGQVIGALWAGSPHDINRDALRLLMAIADISANALHRARLLETLEQRVTERTRELAEANERLQELDRMKSKFVSDVSHELRTPVANLKLHVDLLEHGKPEKLAHYVGTLHEQADRLVRLVEDILNLSRLEIGADKVHFAPIDLNALVKSVVEAHRPAAQMTGLELALSPEPALPLIRGESNQLAQVITNLVANAIHYTPAGEIAVRTRLQEGRACVEVQDTGMGIHAEDRPHLFERFYRGKPREGRPSVRGSGLGLAIVKEIVDLHGGKIEVESEVGAGSTFRVYLPLVVPENV